MNSLNYIKCLYSLALNNDIKKTLIFFDYNLINSLFIKDAAGNLVCVYLYLRTTG